MARESIGAIARFGRSPASKKRMLNMTGQNLTENHYDIILIGSGMGALTVASLMAQMRGKKVLVLERHFKAGGFTHDFKRQQSSLLQPQLVGSNHSTN
ncbi:MAG TPA: NAD(P)-binding protein [Allocoleopsis sp.]